MKQWKRFGALVLCALLTGSLFAGCGKADEGRDTGKLSVYASFYPMYDFAKKIGGDKAEVVNMVPAGTEPHDWEPSASDIAGLEKADLFVYNGAGMEHWAEDVLASLGNKTLTVAEASAGVTLIEGGEEEEAGAEKDDHGGTDPHVWLSPLGAKTELENILKAFVKADPANEAYYRENYEKYAGEFDKLDKEYSDALSPLPNRDLVVAHKAFGYLCAAYGLNQVAIEGLSADSEPDPARVAEIIDFAKTHTVKVIFFEELVSPKVAESIADAVGAQTEMLSPLEGIPEEELAKGADYFSVMRDNLAKLKAALS